MSKNIQGISVPSDLKTKRDALKLPAEMVDGIEIPKSLIEKKGIKSGEDVVRVAIDGVNKTALDFAKDNNISINSTTLNTVDRTKVVN